MKRSISLVMLLLITGSFSPGCSTAMLQDPGRLIGRPRIETHVNRILCLWEPAQGTGTDGRPARGFSGQILFFGPKDDGGARVRGTVCIVEYENYDADDEDPEPLHTFRFESDAWEVHRTEGSLGHSYSVFVPYMKKHRDSVQCALKVEFIDEDGKCTSSDIIQTVLPGKEGAVSSNRIQRNVVRSERKTAAGSDPEDDFPEESETPDVETMESTTIHLPVRGKK
jgi:hypothetical protein